jgi:hypothetical protein
MFVAGNYIFVHIPKTAGKAVEAVLRENFDDFQQITYRHSRHVPLNLAKTLIPGSKKKIKFAIVRNPLSWYVSWFFHIDSFSNKSSSGKRVWTDIKKEVARTFKPKNDIEHFQQWLDLLLNFKGVMSEINEEPFLTMRKTGLRPCSYFYVRYCFSNIYDQDYCIRWHNRLLLTNVVCRMEKIDRDFRKKLKLDIEIPRINEGSHLDYGSYYTPKLASLVKSSDKLIWDRFYRQEKK